MSAELIFSLCSVAVMPGWLLLVFAPRWRWTMALITTVLLPFVIGLVYAGLFLSQLPVFPEGGGFGSVAEVATLFANPYMLTAGWIHYLAFDLFIGAWEVRDARATGIPHWMVLPCLFFTFMLGPLGLACYLLLRSIKTRSLLFEPDSPAQATR